MPSKKWRKMYDCKRTKGQHAWTSARTETNGYQFMKPNSEDGWHVDVGIRGKNEKAIYARWGFWYMTMSVEKFMSQGLPVGAVEYKFKRGRIITCTACGHHEWEREESTDEGATWVPEEHTRKMRIKHGTA